MGIFSPLGNPRMIPAGSALSVLSNMSSKTIALDTTTGSVCTLPQATGSGANFRFIVSVVATSNSHKIQVANATDVISGLCFTYSDDATNIPKAFATTATSDTVTLNRGTTGSIIIGEECLITDILPGVFSVRLFTQSSGTEASPFSAAVS